ncbi:CDP-alcohol phosphatidyltransferase family protein [Lapillicoccus sp.]|uniref:CDP-alcohol phosphatidyltransferase family protein n=1 Tax=Lapillicoccus sp. TaxID=1909287 RepID=UPI003983985C
MWDKRIRDALDGPLRRAAARIDVPWLSPNRLTGAGLVLGLASAAAAATQLWWVSLALWLASRAGDGLDGPLARRREAQALRHSDVAPSRAGGFLDVMADFTVYGSTVVGVAVGATSGEGATWLPFLCVLLAYYVNGAACLAFSSITERTGRCRDDGRSLTFPAGVAEGAETIVVHSLWLVLPQFSGVIASVWAAVVGVSAAHRVAAGYLALR